MSEGIDRFIAAARVLGIRRDVRRFPQGTKTAADAAGRSGARSGRS